MAIPYELGETIKKYRTERKITQKQLANHLGVSEAMVCKYENNTSIPPFDTLRSIASYFRISMDTLCGMPQYSKLPVHGLTESQIDTVRELIETYRVRNARPGWPPTPEQLAVLGKITAEITK